MKTSFFEFNVATTALHTARMGLSVANHNVANAATPGYSRQIVQIRANYPMRLFGGRGMIGTGSNAYNVTQIRDIYLDMKYRNENCVLGEYETKQTQLSFMENILNGLADNGLSALCNDFFASIQELTQNPADGTYRTNMARAADTLAKQVNQLSESLKQQQTDINMDIYSSIQVMNGIGHQIRNLNEQIVRLEADGSMANDLRDARANLVDELSKYVNIESKEVVRNTSTGVKEFVVLVNGYTYVDHFDINPLTVQKRSEKLNPMDAADLYDVYFSNTMQKFDLYSPYLKGELKGLVDTRDGNNGMHFKKTGDSIVTYSAGTKELTITNPSRADLNAPGVLRITDPVSGVASEFAYNSFEYDIANNNVTFTFDKDLPSYVTDPKTDITSGKTVNYKGVPYYMDRLNNFVRTISMALNEGIDLKGNPLPGVGGHIRGYDFYGNRGNLLFSYDGIEAHSNRNLIAGSADYGAIINYNLMNCENFSINKELLDDPKRIAAAKHPEADPDDNENLLELITVNMSNNLFAEGKIADYLVSIAGELGIDLKQATNFSLNYTDVIVSIDIQRKSVSGVDINEEMINVVKFNQLYQAAAMLVNTINDIYDTMINRLGNF